MRGYSNMQENTALIYGSGALAFFYNILDYLHITEAQILSLSAIFLISSLVMMFKCLMLRLSIIQFFVMELISKFCLLFVPFVIAIGAKQIPALSYFVDYIFSLLIIGEIFTIMISIQSIRTRKFIDDVDFFNFFVIKFKAWIYKHFELKRFNEYGKNSFEEWIEQEEKKQEKELRDKAKHSKEYVENSKKELNENFKKDMEQRMKEKEESDYKKYLEFKRKYDAVQEKIEKDKNL